MLKFQACHTVWIGSVDGVVPVAVPVALVLSLYFGTQSQWHSCQFKFRIGIHKITYEILSTTISVLDN